MHAHSVYIDDGLCDNTEGFTDTCVTDASKCESSLRLAHRHTN